MTSETQLYARAILLEEYRNGTTVERAMEKVQAELGSNVINRTAAVSYYELFKSGYEQIADTAHVADCRLVKNGTFLRSKRSLLGELSGPESAMMAETYSVDGRFQFFWGFDQGTIWMVDMFNGTKKEIRIDSSAIKEPMKHNFQLEIMFFIGNSNVCGVFYAATSRCWFKGDFDIVNAVLRIGEVKHLRRPRFTLNTQTEPPTLTSFVGTSFNSYTVDLVNGNVSDVSITDMPEPLWSPIIRNGKLFGFPYSRNGRITTRKLVEISLLDGSKIEHNLEENNDMQSNSICSVWNDGKLMVGAVHLPNQLSTVYKFDISQKKWEKTKIEVEGRIKSMTVIDGTLIVFAFSWKNRSNQFYRFQYGAVDSLANSVWLSMQRYSLQNPSFHDWFLSKLPKNHKLRPLWINRKRKHD